MNNKTKRIIAITTIATMGAAGLANAQTINVPEAQKGIFEQAMSLFKSGKSTEAKQLLTQNGLTPGVNNKAHNKMGMHGKGRGNMQGNRKAIEDAIIAGNFVSFQTVASTSPLKGINQETFNLLTPQFTAKKNAEDQIRNILTKAGVQVPTPGQPKTQ